MTAPPPERPGHGPRPAPSRPAPRPGAPQQPPAAVPVRGAPTPPGPSADAACDRPQPAPGRPAFPAADPLAPTFEDELRAAVSYEKGLAGKALVAIAIVALVLAVRFLFLG